MFVVTRVDGSSQVADGAIIGRTGQYISGVHDAMIAAWSPDSRLLAVGGPAENTITVMDADGSDRQRLIGPAPGSIDHLEWIPSMRVGHAATATAATRSRAVPSLNA